MKMLHLQQVPVVAHTTHNRLSPDLTPTQSRLNISTPNLHHPSQSNPTPDHPIPHTASYSHPHPDILSIYPSIYLSIHTHLYTDAYTLTRSIVNKLLTLYIYIDILTFMWYNQDNGKGLSIC